MSKEELEMWKNKLMLWCKLHNIKVNDDNEMSQGILCKNCSEGVASIYLEECPKRKKSLNRLMWNIEDLTIEFSDRYYNNTWRCVEFLRKNK